MRGRICSSILSSLLLGLLFVATSSGQSKGNQPIFELTNAFAESPNIAVVFGQKFPADPKNAPPDIHTPYQPKDGPLAASKWIIRVIDLATHKIIPGPRVMSVEVRVLGGIVTLMTDTVIDINKFDYLIIYAEANTPLIKLSGQKRPNVQKTFTAAKGKSDADIYFSGTAAAEKNSRPAYSIDSKFGYLHNLAKLEESGKYKDFGSIGATGTFVSSQNSTVDPDSITAAGTYQRAFLFGPSPTGIILTANFIGGEFAKKNKNRNLTTGADATLVLPSKRLNKSEKSPAFATVDFLVGVEAGHNYKNDLKPQGIGNFWRPKLGADFYFSVLKPGIFDRITFSTQYNVRLPQSAEIFKETVQGSNKMFLTTKPRHYIASDLNFMIGPAYGISFKYRYGSLPPSFQLVNSNLSVGLILQLKQSTK
jgi:hypothetical protein